MGKGKLLVATFEALRMQYPIFRFVSYTVSETADTLEIDYHFEIEGLSAFTPHWRFPKPAQALSGASSFTLQQMAFSLGMVELISYWKLTCSPRVEILAGQLDEEQIHWWKRLYFGGLGEFFYRNGIETSPEDFMEIVSMGSVPTGCCEEKQELHGCLIPIGGGKDSAVTLELLREREGRRCGYIINPRTATVETAKAADLPETEVLCAARTLDPAMLALNRQGFLNGHTPFSAIVAFSGLITAYLHRLQYIVLSNESSANESTVAGSTVNHQYSKSFAFEKDFYDYERRHIGSGILYFSLLRPLSEYQIARLFAGMPAYHKIFRSCNAGSKTDSWCGVCPKCLFVYLILSPFLPQEYLARLFGRAMLADETLRPIFDQLIGLQPEKPFECVGSRKEVNTAAAQTVQALNAGGEPLPALLQYYQTTPLYAQYASLPDAYSNYYDNENLLPPEFAALLQKRCIGQVNGR